MLIQNFFVIDDTKYVNCSEEKKCWAIDNRWICLNQNQICDGISHCYDSHDEHYCTLCSDNCEINKFGLKCIKADVPTINSKTENIGKFINWTSHPLSKIISLSSILGYECSMTFYMNNDKPNSTEEFEIHSFYHLHRLRQAILSRTLTTIGNSRDVYLFGPPLLVGMDLNDLRLFHSVEVMIIEQTEITEIPDSVFSPSLEILNFIQNRFLSRLHIRSFSSLYNLVNLTIAGSNLPLLEGDLFIDLFNLTYLNLSDSNINILGVGILDNLLKLRIFDISKNNIHLTSKLFTFNTMLERIFCDSFTICCIRPATVTRENCSAQDDDISSCDNLIGNRVLAAFLWLFGMMALVGNASVIIYRGFIDKSIFTKSYFIFIYNLGIADFLMAIYMLIIAYHDSLYDGIYVWNDYNWKRNALCMASGIISMVSSEASMIFVCLITLERFLCVKFAFGTIKLSRRHATFVSFGVWIIACIISVIPTFTYTNFFSRSGVCIGIPLTRGNDVGLEYAVIIFFGLNFLFSCSILVGQFLIFIEVRKSSKRVQSSQHGRNLAVAKRLAVVVITDCFCWIPIGVLGKINHILNFLAYYYLFSINLVVVVVSSK